MRILWLKTEVLHPVDKGGKIRTYNMLKELKREHHVTYLTLDDGSASADDKKNAVEYCHELVCIPHARREKFTPGFYFEPSKNTNRARCGARSSSASSRARSICSFAIFWRRPQTFPLC
jgi:hypothetical protein